MYVPCSRRLCILLLSGMFMSVSPHGQVSFRFIICALIFCLDDLFLLKVEVYNCIAIYLSHVFNICILICSKQYIYVYKILYPNELTLYHYIMNYLSFVTVFDFKVYFPIQAQLPLFFLVSIFLKYLSIPSLTTC